MTVYHKKHHLVKNGFTLTELLVAVVIMVIIGVIFTDILIESLRGRNKVNAINQVKQNGQVVLDKLSNEIRSAEKIVCVGKYAGSTISDTIVIYNGGTYSQFRLFRPTASLNGKIQKVNFVSAGLPAAATLDNYLCTSLDLDSGAQSLTDTDPKNGVSVNVPPSSQNVFEQSVNSVNSVIIRFNGFAGVSAGFAYDVTVKDGGIPFMTSVQTRGAMI